MRFITYGLGAIALFAALTGAYLLGAHSRRPLAAPPVAQPVVPQAVAAPAPSTPATPLRLGVIGDSLTMPAAAARADSWLRVLIDTGRVTCGAERSDPATSAGRSWRYGWVESGATTETAFAKGWVADAAQALRNGDLDVVVVLIGIDDLALFQSQYLNGTPIPEAHWDEACTRIETNWLRMAHALQGGRGVVVFSEMPDPLGIPLISRFLRGDPRTRAHVQAAVARLNRYLATLTAGRGLPLFDFVRRQQELAIDPAAREFPGVTLLPLASGSQLDRTFAADGTHLGPLATGVLAAGMVEVFNCYQARIPPLLRGEIGDLARGYLAAHATTAAIR